MISAGVTRLSEVGGLHPRRNFVPFRKSVIVGGRTNTTGGAYAAISWSFLPWAREEPEKRLAKELVEEVTSDHPNLTRLNEIVDRLTATSVAFKQSYLSPGPWQVVYTSGPLLWQKLTNSGAVKASKKSNKAYQDFDGSTGTLVNYGELLGEKLYVTAEGTFRILGQSSSLPLDLEANVQRGTLHFFGKTLPLPISGSGSVQLAYTDGQAVRIFKSGGSISVQVKQDLLR